MAFGFGVVGLAAVLAGSLEAGRAYSTAMVLQAELLNVVDEARTLYLESHDAGAAHEAGKARFAAVNPAIKLTDIRVDDLGNSITVVGRAPIDFRILAPFGYGQLQVTHTLTIPLK